MAIRKIIGNEVGVGRAVGIDETPSHPGIGTDEARGESESRGPPAVPRWGH